MYKFTGVTKRGSGVSFLALGADGAWGGVVCKGGGGGGGYQGGREYGVQTKGDYEAEEPW